jgi:thiol-disulfide isomerase/thioredoxin
MTVKDGGKCSTSLSDTDPMEAAVQLKRCALIMAFLAFPILADAQEFSLTDTKGHLHTLEGHQGKWVLVNLWATWCAPCLAEMPDLEALSKSRTDLVVLGVAVDGQNAGRVEQFAEKLHVTYPIIGGDPKLAQQFRPKGYPTSILYDKTGHQVMVKEGPIDRQAVENMLNR